MEGFFARSKRVSQPLHDQVKAQLISYPSSGSDHSAADDDDGDLSELIHGFLEDDDGDQTQSRKITDHEFDSDRVDSVNHRTESLLKTTLYNAVAGSSVLLSLVLNAMERFKPSRSEKSVFNRKVMSFLREIGYNAAICKTKWESSGGLTAGSYEYIDVVVQSNSLRYIIELDFASEFEIARPTSVYTRLIESLPTVLVCKSEEMKTIVKLMSDEAKRSLKSRELLLPPWRKNRYMQNKWFGPYRRTVNPIVTVTVTENVTSSIPNVNCRTVGFNVGLNAGLFVRTR